MKNKLSNAISELSLRMRLIKSLQEEKSSSQELTDRDLLLLEMISKAGSMTVSQIAAMHPNVSDSTISTAITHLWRDKKVVSKSINPENQRVTNVQLTEKGRQALETYALHQKERYKTMFEAMQMSDEEAQTLNNIVNRAVKVLDSRLSKDKTAAAIIKTAKNNEML